MCAPTTLCGQLMAMISNAYLFLMFSMLYADASTLYELVRRGARKSTSKMMLGSRIVQPDGTAPYKWITYDEAIGRSIDIAYAFRELDLPAGQETCIGIYSKNRPEWIFIGMQVKNSYCNMVMIKSMQPTPSIMCSCRSTRHLAPRRPPTSSTRPS